MEKQLHIVLACSRLDLPGGIERSVVNIANLLYAKGHPVTLLIMDETPVCFYPVQAGIRIIQKRLQLGIGQKGNVLTRKIALLKHIITLRNVFKHIKPDAVIGTEYAITIAIRIAAHKLNIITVSREAHHFYWLQKNRFWNYLFHKIYPTLDWVVCLNNHEAALFRTIGCKTTVIPNFLSQASKPIFADTKQILTIGWLIKRKGVDLIPKMAQKIFAYYPDWHWLLIGQGEEYEHLKNEIEALGLQHHIRIIPPVKEIATYYQQTSIYVMPSRSEAFPNVLMEAMSFGLPCVAFDCPSGPSDILSNAIDGFLIELENVDQMADAIKALIADNEQRKKMGEQAHRNIQRFSPDAVYPLWKRLFTSGKDV